LSLTRRGKNSTRVQMTVMPPRKALLHYAVTVLLKAWANRKRNSANCKLVSCAEDLNLARGLFQNSLFQLLLAFDAVPGPRHGFQPLGIDFFAAGDALPKTALAEPLQCSLHHLQQLPVIVALMKEKFFGVRAGSTVGDILGRILIYGPTILLSTGHRAAQVQLPRFQSLLEIVQFLFVHG